MKCTRSRKLSDLMGRMHTHIGTDYNTISGLIWLRLGMLMFLHALYFSNSFKVIKLCDSTIGQLAVQSAMHLRGEMTISQARPASI